jgi:creatinine amidohydrolase
MFSHYMFLPSNKIDFDSPVFLPVGSIEIHGSTLPLGTDSIIAMAFALKAAEKVHGMTLPPVYFGICPNTGRFRQTISVTHEGFYFI